MIPRPSISCGPACPSAALLQQPILRTNHFVAVLPNHAVEVGSSVPEENSQPILVHVDSDSESGCSKSPPKKTVKFCSEQATMLDMWKQKTPSALATPETKVRPKSGTQVTESTERKPQNTTI
jgi:hypothetical protein